LLNQQQYRNFIIIILLLLSTGVDFNMLFVCGVCSCCLISSTMRECQCLPSSTAVTQSSMGTGRLPGSLESAGVWRWNDDFITGPCNC